MHLLYLIRIIYYYIIILFIIIFNQNNLEINYMQPISISNEQSLFIDWIML